MNSTETIENSNKSNSKSNLFLLLIIVFGVGLRFRGVDYGLPLRLHPDEYAIINSTIHVVENNKLETTSDARPIFYSIYVNAVGYKLYTIYLCEKYQKCENTQEALNPNNPTLVLISRMIAAINGSLFILSMYLISRLISGRSTSLIVAGITAFFPSFIQHSHYATVNMAVTFLISMVLLFSILYIQRRKTIYIIVAIVFFALAALEKYPGALSAVMILYAVLKANWENKKQLLLVGLGVSAVSVIGLFALSPQFIKFIPHITQYIKTFLTYEHLGASGLSYWGTLAFYWKHLVNNLNIIFSLILLLGIALIFVQLIKHRKSTLIFIPIVFGIMFWLIMSILSNYWERWAVPMYMMPILVVGATIPEIYNYLLTKKKVWQYVFLLILGIASLSLISRGVRQNLLFIVKDTRTASLSWIEGNLPPNALFAYDGYTPLHANCCGSAGNITVEQHQAKGIAFIVTSSYMFDRYMNEADKYPKLVEFYQSLEAYDMLISFEPDIFTASTNDLLSLKNNSQYIYQYLRDNESVLTGPRIYIYDIRD